MPRKPKLNEDVNSVQMTPRAYLLERLGGRQDEGPRPQAHWSACEMDVIAEFMDWWMDGGGAMIFGRSRSGDMLNLTLLAGGTKKTIWFAPGPKLSDEVWAIYQQLKEMDNSEK